MNKINQELMEKVYNEMLREQIINGMSFVQFSESEDRETEIDLIKFKDILKKYE